MGINEFELDILELKERYKKARNEVDKAKIIGEIEILQNKITREMKSSNKEVVLQKEVPIRADHISTSTRRNTKVFNNDNLIKVEV
jgi:hypothetical protein